MEEIIKKIKKKLFVDQDLPQIYNKKFEIFEIKKDNFKKIEKSEKKKLIFIDGGSQELFSAPNISLFFNRIYYCVYNDNKRIKNRKYEFYSLIYTEEINKELFFKTEFFLLDKKIKIPVLKFSVKDETLSFGKNIVDISVLGSNIRKILEIKIASQIEESNSIIVMDRNLEKKITYEEEFFNELCEKAKKNKNFICGLAKTSTLLTKKGNSLSALLNSFGPKEEWYYVVASGNDINICFVKLNSKSNYVFRLDIIKDCNKEEIFYNLMLNSSDPVFLGYPYGLIEADKNARVSNKEIDFLKIQLIAKYGDEFKEFKKYLQSKDAHSILDNIG
jgi:hypothetical protein